MKLSFKTILPILLTSALLILLVGCLPGLTPPPPKGVISGRIMVPSSETTKDITGWIPVANATVTLTDSEGVTHTVTTDEDGYYTFTDIAVNANTIITATATVDGNTVIIKDVILQAVAADEDYDAGTADAESTTLALIVEELLEQGLDPEDINLEEIQDSDNFTEVVEQVSSILEENGNVTTDPGVTETVSNAAEDIINPHAYTPPEPFPEPVYTPPIIATASTIANGAATPIVTVTGTNFKSTIAASDLTVDVGTTGLTLGTVTYVNVLRITVAFTGTAAAGDVTIQAKTSAFTPAGVSASNTLTVTVPAA
jgi:hypothetical protein